MTPPSELIVEQSLPTKRLDAFLSGHFPDISRGLIKRLLDEHAILVNGKPAKPAQAPRQGDRIEIRWPEPKNPEQIPEDIPLQILYEDPHLLVLNKSPDIVVHPAAGNEDGTLVNALLHHCAGELSGINGVYRPGIVHRLDKETSGCLLVAKSDAAHLGLAEQFASRTLQKQYHALVIGRVNPLHDHIKVPIARHPSHRKCMAVTLKPEKGRDAWTEYWVETQTAWTSLVRIRLHTGRTHQIRVHFQHLSHPLVGDMTYGKNPNQRLIQQTGFRPLLQMLHASQISFRHPVLDQWMTLQAPWPDDFQTAVSFFSPTGIAPTTSA